MTCQKSYTYLQEGLKWHELLLAFLEEDGEDAPLPHLVQDADAQRGCADGQQQQQQVGEPPVAAHCVASWSVLTSIHLHFCVHPLANTPPGSLVLLCLLQTGTAAVAAVWRNMTFFSVAWVLERKSNLLRYGGTRLWDASLAPRWGTCSWILMAWFAWAFTDVGV